MNEYWRQAKNVQGAWRVPYKIMITTYYKISYLSFNFDQKSIWSFIVYPLFPFNFYSISFQFLFKFHSIAIQISLNWIEFELESDESTDNKIRM